MGNNKPKSELTGRRFGHLYVNKYVGRGRWECKCDCGQIINEVTRRLLDGERKSCYSKCKCVNSQKGLLKPYVYKCLREYGNTVVSNKTFKQLGKHAILNDLQEHGLTCSIVKFNYTSNTYKIDETNIIIEIKQ